MRTTHDTPERRELNRALEKIDVSTYLDREGVDYKHSFGGSGEQLNLSECPACGEGGRKTYINAQTGLGNCFHGGCGFKFNKFKLIQKVSGLGGAALDQHIKSVAQEQGWMPKRERIKIVLDDLKLPSDLQALPNAEGRILKYLDDRGVTPESCERFGLSFCKKGFWGAKLSDESTKWVFFGGRVVIPILDLAGKLVSFQARDITGEQEPKYLFPSGYAVAGRHLYNGNSFQEGVHKHAIVGEGAFDAIAVDQALQSMSGVESVIPLATFGMHLSGGPDSQVEKFCELRERGLEWVTFMWDGEGKALSYAVTAGELLKGVGLKVRVAMLPPRFDPAQGPDKRPTPPSVVLESFFKAQELNLSSAIRLKLLASRMSK